jgi:hypothetical protein
MSTILAGCVGRQFPLERANEIVAGQSTKSDVKMIMGEPISKGIHSGFEVWTYYHGNNLGSKTYSVCFDKEGIVTDGANRYRGVRTGSLPD